MTEIRFQLTEADLIAAQRLYHKAALKRYASSVCCGLAILLGLYFDDLGSPGALAIIVAYAILVVLVIPGVRYFWRIPRLAAETFRQDKSLSEIVALSWDEKNIRYETEAGSWCQPITSFVAWRANVHMVLLFRQTRLYHPIPARAFPDAEARNDLLNRLTENGVSTKWPPK